MAKEQINLAVPDGWKYKIEMAALRKSVAAGRPIGYQEMLRDLLAAEYGLDGEVPYQKFYAHCPDIQCRTYEEYDRLVMIAKASGRITLTSDDAHIFAYATLCFAENEAHEEIGLVRYVYYLHGNGEPCQSALWGLKEWVGKLEATLADPEAKVYRYDNPAKLRVVFCVWPTKQACFLSLGDVRQIEGKIGDEDQTLLAKFHELLPKIPYIDGMPSHAKSPLENISVTL